MRDLLYKEIRLAVHPSLLIFLFCGSLLLIPSWPFFIAFGYLFIGFTNTFFIGRGNQDVFFTAALPVRKKDVVRARVLIISAFQILQILAAVPFAFLHQYINPYGNQAGMNPNLAFFGCVFLMYALFNAVFFPLFYKTAYKVGGPMVLAVLAVLLFAAAVEVAVHVIPWMNTHVNAMGGAHLSVQLPVLAGGIAAFLLVTWLACRKAAVNFDKVDL